MTRTQIQTLIDNIEDGGLNSAADVRQILNALKDEICKVGEVKMSFDAAILEHFDATGLGTGEYAGYALANGNNGTKNLVRRSPIGYDRVAYTSGFNYNSIGSLFGEETHLLSEDEMPEHDHEYSILETSFAGDNTPNTEAVDYKESGVHSRTSKKGKGQPHNNIQPSTVVIFYQRIN